MEGSLPVGSVGRINWLEPGSKDFSLEAAQGTSVNRLPCLSLYLLPGTSSVPSFPCSGLKKSHNRMPEPERTHIITCLDEEIEVHSGDLTCPMILCHSSFLVGQVLVKTVYSGPIKTVF